MALTVGLSEVSSADLALVGGKASKLGDLVRQGLPVPPGIVVTTEAYERFASTGPVADAIRAALGQLDPADGAAAERASRTIREAFERSEVPDDLAGKLRTAIAGYLKESAAEYSAVRSSATAEDLEGASFAGMQETYLNVHGAEEILSAVRRCWGSLFTPRAIAYRAQKGAGAGPLRLAVVVQKMVDASTSGILFTRDPNTGENHLIIEAGFGLGEAIVGGEVTPDHYVVDGASQQIVQKLVSEQPFKIVRAAGGGNRRVDLDAAERGRPKLTDDQIRRLSSLARVIESHYRRPMDVEWCGDDQQLYIVQARPITTLASPMAEVPRRPGQPGAPPAPGEAPALVTGFGASPGVAVGTARILRSASEIGRLLNGEVLVTTMTTPDMVPAMVRSAAIVTDEGGITCHAAIVARELGLPCVVGTRSATSAIPDGQTVTVDGKAGRIDLGDRRPAGAAPTAAPAAPASGSSDHTHVPVTATRIYVNVGVPEKAADYARLPVQGVGLLRTEFIFTAHIREHPLAMIAGGRTKELVDRLAEGLATVCRAFQPRPVIIRTSDFKTNEYRGMPGGEPYEPREENPMIGWRGCSRYVSPVYRPAFLAELQAIRKVREEMGLRNAMIMLPFVRNTRELEEIEGMMRAEGLRRGRDLQLYLMAEVPSTVLLAGEFAKHCDGFSIGSNDLTQLILGADRDSEILGRMGYFDERDPAVLRAIGLLIQDAHAAGRTVGICGQGPSTYPEFAEFLVRQGIDSISLNADTVLSTIRSIASLEQRMKLEGLRDRRR